MVQVGEWMETWKMMLYRPPGRGTARSQPPFSEEILPTLPAWVRDILEEPVVLLGHWDRLKAKEAEDHDSAMLTVLVGATMPWIPDTF